MSAAVSASRLASTDGNPWALVGESGAWFRGNLHCHTTESDGRLTPQETVDWFRAAGYDFLALTDHNRITDPASLRTDGLCLIPATELTASGGELGAAFHLIGLGLPVEATLPPVATPAAESAAWLREQGAVAFVAHPFWSGLTVADMLALPVAGIEVYNGGTVLDSQKGEAVSYWDEGLARGARWWGIAVDDTHWHTIDRGLGWIMARAPELSPAAVLQALAHGHFYATTGPDIRRVNLTPEPGGVTVVEVETSPCAAIYALGFGSRNQFAFEREAAARGELGATITRATFRVRPETLPGRYVRVQCVDWQRRSAWSNPLVLEHTV
ncbi:MAG: PHP domain-containing protein [Chloroflexota bacterium]